MIAPCFLMTVRVIKIAKKILADSHNRDTFDIHEFMNLADESRLIYVPTGKIAHGGLRVKDRIPLQYRGKIYATGTVSAVDFQSVEQTGYPVKITLDTSLLRYAIPKQGYLGQGYNILCE